MDASGMSALECFCAFESEGKIPPCREPELLDQYLAGKEVHGITVTSVAEDFVGRVAFSAEIKANYPQWVANEIFCRAEQMAAKTIGFVPTFIRTRMDFSEL